MKPMKPAEPMEAAITWNNPAKVEATHDPTKAQKNGNRNFKLTPKIAGSVIPSKAETAEELESPFILESLVKK